MLLWKIARFAVSKKLLSRDPFLGYVPERIKRNDDFLTEEEFIKILSLDIQNAKLWLSRDMFVFSAFTGLYMCDIEELEQTDISTLSDGELWIIKKRKNTAAESKIFLLDIPIRIIRKYKGHHRDKIFKAPSRATIGNHMKIISQLCRLDRDVVFRFARPCFANLITLEHGVPVETVSHYSR